MVSDDYDRQFAKRISNVLIESPSLNSRRITANTIIEGSVEDVWSILTDYDNLSTHIPNLVQSNKVPTSYPSGITLFQEGAQKIMGFDFSASLTMNMDEVYDERERRILFKLVDSFMFSQFDGDWSIKLYSRTKVVNPVTKEVEWKYKTQLTYSVAVRPKGPVPVVALEWRIREDIPLNLLAVKIASEKLANENGASGSGSGRGGYDDMDRGSGGAGGGGTLPDDWSSDETLGMYIGSGGTTGGDSGGAKSSSNSNTMSPQAKVSEVTRAMSSSAADKKSLIQSWGRDAWGRMRRQAQGEGRDKSPGSGLAL